MIFPPLTMREFDRVWGDVRRPEFVVRTDTVLLFSLPAKVYPCAAVMQSSRFRARSAGLSVDGAAATLQVPSGEETALAWTSFPPEKRDSRKVNISRSSLTEGKYTQNPRLLQGKGFGNKRIPYYLYGTKTRARYYRIRK